MTNPTKPVRRNDIIRQIRHDDGTELRSVRGVSVTRIYLNGALRLVFPHKQVASVLPWRDTKTFHIDILFKDGPGLMCGYDNERLALSISSLIDDALSGL